MEILLGGLAVSFLGKAAWLWLVFLGLVVLLLVLDLGVLHRKEREIGVGESLALSLGYITVGLAFGAWIWLTMGAEPGLNYLTGFAVEKSLALDNIFVISMIFSYFAVPRRHQHRVLFWGVLGVIVLRGIMIGLGAALVERFDWILWLFGAFLAVTGVKMLVVADHAPGDLSDNPVLRFLRKRLRVTPELHGHHFFVRQASSGGRTVWWATPLFLCLILVELADIVFAVDSVPAIFAITTDPYIVYTSNIFAILGLRALYFALAAMIHRFTYLKYALALVLVFIGGKIFWAQVYGKPDPALTLAVTIGLIGGGVAVSLWRSRNAPPPVPEDGRAG
ncbi:inner membrane protein, (Integral membrane protein TerC, riboswitch-linked,17-321) [Magnetospirillum sp. XM-1]|uniref:TerC family protein n=1 Tax=Magnetospirillum sp. XM-1 TaxID=1663591 RepID=UPI00073DCE0E|nr:TerC family protein [Magnetospirillum sp. XM-1]CUW38391.1 inner membrane protein, (Integral membrane protein TerC, riboswitch-linked,17-321) [Magnetospirillum sp. XM-1]